MDQLLEALFQPNLSRRQLLELAPKLRTDSTESVTSYVEKHPPTRAAVQGLWKVVRKGRREVSSVLCEEAQPDLDPELVRAVTAGEFVLANLGPAGTVALDLFVNSLQDRLDLGDGLELDLSGLAHQALRSAGPAAASALERLQALPDDPETGYTLASLVSGVPELQHQVWVDFENSGWEKVETLLGFVEELPPEELLSESLLRACKAVSDRHGRNALLARLKFADPDHPAISELIASGPAPSGQAGARPYFREGRSLGEWLLDYLEGHEPADQHLFSMALGMVEEGCRPVAGESPEQFALALQATLEEADYPTDRVLSGIFARLTGADTHDSYTQSRALVIDSTLADSLGLWAGRLQPQLQKFVKSRAGNGLSRRYIFQLVGNSGCPDLLWPVMEYLSASGRDYDSAFGEALAAAGRLLRSQPESQQALLERAFQEQDSTPLLALAQTDRLAPGLAAEVFARKDEPWVDLDLCVRLIGLSGTPSVSLIEFLQHRCGHDEPYSKAVAQEALIRCWGNREGALALLRRLLSDQDYGFAVYEGWVCSPVELLKRFGGAAAPLAEAVLTYSEEEGQISLLLDFLEGLGPDVARVRELVLTLREERLQEDPLELDAETRRLGDLVQVATGSGPAPES